MAERDAESNNPNPDDEGGLNKVTSFGEPLWVDAIKSIAQGLVMLVIVLVLGGALAVAIIAPWGRASHDCSIYCVLERKLGQYWPGG